jgi:uncharacterized protein (DUF1330 family)
MPTKPFSFRRSSSVTAVLMGLATSVGSIGVSYAADQKAYIVNEIQVTDAAKYKEYADQVPPTLAPFGGTFMIRGGNPAVLSGAPIAGRIVVVEFPNREKALAWHESAAYQKILPIRNASSTSRVYVVDGAAP